MSSLTIEPVVGLTLLALIGAGMVLVNLIRPKFRSATPVRRTTLLVLRLVLTVLMLTAMIRPGCIRTVERPQTATVLFFFDESRSMRLPHEAAGDTRWEKLNAVVRQNRDRLTRLGDKLELKAYSFGARAQTLEFVDGQLRFSPQPSQGQTDMGTSLAEGLAPHRSQRLAAVILLSDGRQNADDPQTEIQQAVAQLDQQQVPLYTVPFGQPSDAGQASDVSIVGLPDQFSIFVKNRLGVQATLRLRGLQNQQIPVQLLVTDPSGTETVVDTQLVTASKPDEVKAVTLGFTPEEPGQYLLTVQAEEQPRELVTQNNRLPAFLTVHEGGLKVLYVEGYLRTEQTFLRRSLAASPDIELDFQWIDHRNRDRWPIDLADTFRDPSYDVFVLGDLDSRALHQPGQSEETLEALVAAVENGKGLVMLGGYHSFGPGRYHATPLSGIMPIQMQRFEAQDFNSRLNFDLHIERPLVMVPAMNHYITNLVPGPANLDVWKSLEPLKGANRFLGVKDRSLILAESTTGEPLLVAGNYGGRVLAFAGDSTWQWWTHGQAEYHKRFWRQMILWLAKLDGIASEDVWIDMPQRRFAPGSSVMFVAGARAATGEPIDDAELEATVIRPDGERVRAIVNRSSDGNYGEIPSDLVDAPGSYTLEVTATLQGGPLGRAELDFIVFDEDREQSLAAADPNQLGLMAAQTADWGGRVIRPEEFGELLDDLEALPLELEIEVPQKWQLGDTLLDSLLFIGMFLGVLGSEWFLRKKWGLV